jgi:hypothetical protein
MLKTCIDYIHYALYYSTTLKSDTLLYSMPAYTPCSMQSHAYDLHTGYQNMGIMRIWRM